jgi:hypothetical protein
MCEGFDLGCWGESFINGISAAFFKIFELLVLGIVKFIDLMPLPFDGTDVTNAINALPSEVFWAFNLFDIGQGVTIVLSAYLIRFIIRRLPVIG